jgi:hypothetical protein
MLNSSLSLLALAVSARLATKFAISFFSACPPSFVVSTLTCLACPQAPAKMSNQLSFFYFSKASHGLYIVLEKMVHFQSKAPDNDSILVAC